MKPAKSPRVEEGCVVSIHYTLTDDGGEVLDSSRGGAPLDYLHGVGNLVPGLERELAGKGVGERLQVVVSPAEGYGEIDPDGIFTESIEAFPPGSDVGMEFGAEDGRGEMIPVWITRIEGNEVTVDRNHPLAGKRLHFDVTIEKVRRATREERDHGHAHGPGGHSH